MRGKYQLWLPGLLALLVIGLLAADRPVRAQEGVCDNAPEPRLTIGGWAVVTDAVSGTAAGGLRLREAPRINAAEVALLSAGTGVRVLEGPACNDGFRWWHLGVLESGADGWSAEGLAGVYYLAPTAAPPPTQASFPPTNTPSAPAAVTTSTPPLAAGNPTGAECPDDPAASYLRVGVTAQVLDQAHPVRLRPEPAVDSIFTGMIYRDTPLTVTDGPVCADGLRWWQVQGGGLIGWTVEAANGRYLLADPNNPPPAVIFSGRLSEVPPRPTLPPPGVTLVPTPRPLTPPGVFKRAVFTPDGALLAIGAGDGVHLYDAAAYTPQGTLAVGPVFDFVTINGSLYAVTWDQAGISVIGVPGGAIYTLLTGGPYDPAWAAAAPDGAWLILGPTSDGSTATLWDLNTARPPDFPPFWWPGWGVVSAAFSPDNRYVLINDVVSLRSCQTDGTGCLFDLVRSDFLAAGIFGDVGWSGDGTMMIGFSDRFWLWDGNALGVGFTLRSTLEMQNPRRVALNVDASVGAVAVRRLMELWNLAGGNYYANRVIQLPGDVRSLAFRPDGAHLVATAGDAVAVYDAVSGDPVRQVE